MQKQACCSCNQRPRCSQVTDSNKRILIYKQHFRNTQYHVHDTYKTLILEEMPELNVPVESITFTKLKPRPSAESIPIKKQIDPLPATSML